MEDLQKAKECLQEQAYTCVLCKGDTIYTSRQRGVAPLLNWLDTGIAPVGFSAADRVVGKATAYLYQLLGVQAVYAAVISRPAAQVLQAAGITVSWGKQVDAILNRQKDGPCPMDAATMDCQTPQQALQAIRQTLEKLQRA
jgi:hypothetical protein